MANNASGGPAATLRTLINGSIPPISDVILPELNAGDLQNLRQTNWDLSQSSGLYDLATSQGESSLLQRCQANPPLFADDEWDRTTCPRTADVKYCQLRLAHPRELVNVCRQHNQQTLAVRVANDAAIMQDTLIMGTICRICIHNLGGRPGGLESAHCTCEETLQECRELAPWSCEACADAEETLHRESVNGVAEIRTEPENDSRCFFGADAYHCGRNRCAAIVCSICHRIREFVDDPEAVEY